MPTHEQERAAYKEAIKRELAMMMARRERAWTEFVERIADHVGPADAPERGTRAAQAARRQV